MREHPQLYLCGLAGFVICVLANSCFEDSTSVETECEPGHTNVCACQSEGIGTMTCMSDGLWGTCIGCPSETTCGCGQKQCGTDGCGGSCGSCSSGQTCESGFCVAQYCSPSCGGAQCGDDGCGGECGICPPSFLCMPDGTCFSPDNYYANCLNMGGAKEPCEEHPVESTCAAWCNYFKNVCFDPLCTDDLSYFTSCVNVYSGTTVSECEDHVCFLWAAQDEGNSSLCL